MTTLPTTPPAPFAAPRPAPAPAAPAGLAIDPIKLLKRHKWLLLASVAAGALLGAGANWGLTYAWPRWRPYALFTVSPPVERVGQTTSMENPEATNRFMQTQIKQMTSDGVIRQVVEDPQLKLQAPNWCGYFSKKTAADGSKIFDTTKAMRDLKTWLSVRQITGTSLIELSYSDRHKEDATFIVKSVRDKYLDALKMQLGSQRDDNTKSLREAIARIDDEVKNRQTRRNNMIGKEKIESYDERASAAQLQLQRLQDERIKVNQDLMAAQSQVERMQADMNSDFPVDDDTKQEAERDPTVIDMRTAISRMEAELASMKEKGMTADHREYKAMASRLKGSKQNLDDVVVKVQQKLFNSRLDKLNTMRQSLTSQLKSLDDDITVAKARAIELGQFARDLGDIDREIDNLLKTRGDLNSQLQEIITVAESANFNRVNKFGEVEIPSELDFPQLKFMIPLGILLSLGAVGGLVVVREIADQRIKGPSDVNLVPRAKLLGWVPDADEDPEGKGAPETAFRDRPRGVVAESYRQLRTAFIKRIDHSNHKVVLVLSGMPGAGSTSVVANLAMALAAADRRVLVIDANLRRPTMHRVFGAQESPGLADVMMDSKTFAAAVQRTSTPNVDFLSAGSKELRVVERLAARAKGDILAAAREAYDIVLIDVAPAVVAGDALTLAQRADATMLVVRAMSDKRGMVARIAAELTGVRSEFLGVVVNGVRASSGGYLRGNIRTAAEYAKSE